MGAVLMRDYCDMNLSDLAPYAYGERQTYRFTSAGSAVFLADLMAPVSDDGIGINGFGMDDVAMKLAANDVTVTLFALPDLTPWDSRRSGRCRGSRCRRRRLAGNPELGRFATAILPGLWCRSVEHRRDIR